MNLRFGCEVTLVAQKSTKKEDLRGYWRDFEKKAVFWEITPIDLTS